MSRLEELIQTLCPDGVEYVNLGDFASINKGKQLNLTEMRDEAPYPVINGGVDPSGNFYEYNTEENTITVSQGGASAGYVNFILTKFWAGAHCYVVKPKNARLNNKYLFYFIKNSEQKIQDAKYGAGIPGLNKSTLEQLSIPLPPLPVQEETVRILDTFSDVVVELEAEQKARVKQYEHYRNELLSFDSKSKIIEKLLADFCPDEVEYLELQQIFNFRNGYTPSRKDSENWNDGTISWFTLKDLRKNGGILSESIEKIAPKGVKKGLFEANSIIISTLATIGEHAIILNNALANQQMTCLTRKKKYKDLLTPKFVYYYCFLLGEWCRANIHVSGFASVDMVRFAKFKFPIPPLSVQEEIVSILDRFDTLVKDLKSGLPAEITLRRKQYEYYRDKLLSFEPSE